VIAIRSTQPAAPGARLETKKTMIIVLMGVTGSGKTTVGQLLAAELGWQYYDADDFHSPGNIEKMRRGIPLDDGDRRPWLETLRELIRSRLQRGENCVLACSALKRSYRDYVLLDEHVSLVYLKGTRELIQQRLSERRDHYMNPMLLASQFEILEEPEGALAIDVSLSTTEIVKRIRVGLGL
jgi:gluconokinase